MLNYLFTIQFFLLFIGFGSVFSMFNSTLPDYLLLIINGLILFINHKINLNKKSLILLLFYFIVLIFHAIITSTSIFLYFGLFFRILNVFILCSLLEFDINKIKKYFIKSIWIVLALSIVNLFLINLLPDLFSVIETNNGFSVSSLIYIFNFNSTINIFNFNIYRNQGMFWEPGVLQIPLLFLLFHLIIEKKQVKKSIIVILTLISTFSTTGIIGMSIIFMVYFITNFNNSKNKIYLSFKLFFISLCITPIVYYSIDHKLNDERDNISSVARAYDLFIGLKVIANNPSFGLGIDDRKYLNETRKESVSIFDSRIDEERGNTNALITFFIKFGIPFSILILIFFYNQNLFQKKLAFFIILILVLSSEPIVFSNIWFLLILSGISKIKMNDNQRQISLQ